MSELKEPKDSSFYDEETETTCPKPQGRLEKPALPFLGQGLFSQSTSIFFVDREPGWSISLVMGVRPLSHSHAFLIFPRTVTARAQGGQGREAVTPGAEGLGSHALFF